MSSCSLCLHCHFQLRFPDSPPGLVEHIPSWSVHAVLEHLPNSYPRILFFRIKVCITVVLGTLSCTCDSSWENGGGPIGFGWHWLGRCNLQQDNPGDGYWWWGCVCTYSRVVVSALREEQEKTSFLKLLLVSRLLLSLWARVSDMARPRVRLQR